MHNTCPRCDAAHAPESTRCTACGFSLTMLPLGASPLRPEPDAQAASPMPPRAPTHFYGPPPKPEIRPSVPLPQPQTEPDQPSWWRRTLLAVPEDVDKVDVGARALVWLLLAWWTASHLSMSVEQGDINAAWMHRIHLVFHEAGHIFFLILGDFMTVLGGSLMQMIMPSLFLVAFLLKYRNAFGGVVTLWWLGDSMVDLAPYIHDARAQKMILLGGVTGQDVPGYHDWNNLLGRLGWLQHDHTLASLTWTLGALLMTTALLWGLALLYLQLQKARQRVLF